MDADDSGVTVSPCTHHWLIDPPSGETSQAVCKLCGARREFDHSSDARFIIRRTRSANTPATNSHS